MTDRERQLIKAILIRYKNNDLSFTDAVIEIERQWPEPKNDYKLDNR